MGGLVTTNVVISLVLYFNDRTPLHRLLASFWVAGAVAVLLQGAMPEPPLTIVGFFVPGLVLAMTLADFLRRVLSLKWHGRVYAAVAVGAAIAALVANALHAPFWGITIPLSVAAAVPIVDVVRQALMSAQKLTVVQRMTVLAAASFAAHQLDYPFLRPDPRFIPHAFAIAIILFLALSICAPLMILERSNAEIRRLQAVALERERFSALGEAAAVVAHEVRNPLATMTNTIQLLRREPLSNEAQDLLAIQRDEIMRLDRLVRDLLSFSKPLQPQLVEVDLSALVRDAVRSLRADAAAARVELEVADRTESFVRGDADTIHVALVNVLQNAIQASPDGGKIRIALANGGAELRVRVDDEGDGVPTDAMKRVFEPFFTTRATGSGLGLAILDRIMKAHGGSVRVSNLPEKGARFELVFASAGKGDRAV